MISEMDLQKLTLGFEDPDLGPQQTFRAILEAMAHPGQLVNIKSKLYFPELINMASAAVCLTLLNNEKTKDFVYLCSQFRQKSDSRSIFKSNCRKSFRCGKCGTGTR